MFVSNRVIAGRRRDLTDDLRCSRVENGHFDDGLEVILSFRDVAFSAWLLADVEGVQENEDGVPKFVEQMSRTLGIYLDLCASNRVEWWLWCAI